MNLLLVKSIYSLSNTNFVFNTVIQGNVADARIVEHYINLNISPEGGFPLLGWSEDFLYINTSSCSTMEIIALHWNNCTRTLAAHKAALVQK